MAARSNHNKRLRISIFCLAFGITVYFKVDQKTNDRGNSPNILQNDVIKVNPTLNESEQPFLHLRHLLMTSLAPNDSLNSNSSNITLTTTPAPLFQGCVDGQVEFKDYPPDIFTCDQKKKGAIILHVLGLAYMFVALAIVCDEFFVPSLSVIIERIDISEDVAGATFMAAGGSAPELATSFIGTFASENNVGIGTIVGSAVFNILFVISMCTFFSKNPLKLTWWPLVRDLSFYITSLIILILCYLDDEIDWYESLILLICYASYVTFMKFNAQAENVVKTQLEKRFGKKETPPGVDVNGNGIGTIENGVHSNGQKDTEEGMYARRRSIPILNSASGRFRHGVFQLMIHTIDPLAEDQFNSRVSRLHDIVKKKQSMGLKTIVEDPSTTVIPDNGLDVSVDTNRGIDGTRSDLKSSQTMVSNLGNSLHSLDGLEAAESISTSVAIPALPPTVFTNNKSDESVKTNDSNKGTEIEVKEDDEIAQDEEENDEVPLDLSWPETLRERVIYVFIMPIVIILWITLFDVRKPNRRNFFIWTFLGSIIWIGAFSYCMAWWATLIGQIVGIPDDIMGLTFLAAGTSIPDLLTSVIVAKKGFGDMAVSSSIGSNIFDITICLPLPWILRSASKLGLPVSVTSIGMFCSIMLLFGMLMAVVIGIILFKWTMTKGLGVAMMILYVIFITMSILLGYGYIPCLLKFNHD